MRSSSRSHPISHGIDDAVSLIVQSCPDDREVTAELREQIVLAALELADSVALRYRGRGVDLEDLRQVARLALVKAAARYRPAAGTFTSFAVPTIMGEVKRHFRDHGWVVRPPRSLQEGRMAVTSAQESLRHLLGRDATIEELAEVLGIDESIVRETQLCGSGFRPASLDAPLTPSGTCLGDNMVEPDDPYASIEERAMLREGMRLLTDRERLVVRLRFGEELSQADIGARIGVSQMQVSRILASITRRLRVHLDPSIAA
ncbi:MAG: sigma-70 family RNA polymerase sigma factor [Ornithinibacter sp.]